MYVIIIHTFKKSTTLCSSEAKIVIILYDLICFRLFTEHILEKFNKESIQILVTERSHIPKQTAAGHSQIQPCTYFLYGIHKKRSDARGAIARCGVADHIASTFLFCNFNWIYLPLEYTVL